MFSFITKVFGSRNERVLKQIYPLVEQVNKFESATQALTDAELTNKTQEFKDRIEKGESLDHLLPEAFAVVREAAVRALGMRHYDVQILGGIILHQGKIAEMKTGEGKTLVATLPSYLHALTGKGVHVVTVNDYLASRDAAWMGKLYHFLGLSVGTIVSGISNEDRRAAYASDITYGTNNEFGFDYLRDNMAFADTELVQRGHYFSIVDEVDSILVDEARTPLIISGPAEEAGNLYDQGNDIILELMQDESNYEKDEKERSVMLTEDGTENIEQLLHSHDLLPKDTSLYDAENVNVLHATTQALRANTLFTKEVDYIVRNNEVIIIDEFTGRMMPGRRYSDGLHQSLESKEGVTVKPENQTLASVTFQNYFRMYDILSGMTGTADTEAEEFHKIYKLEVVMAPPNREISRDDMADLIFRDQGDKFNAIVDDIVAVHATGQPILVGTTSIEKSEEFSEILSKKNIKHEVLNAKHHDREAEIVAQAGRKNALTIATNMAGRGTDIMLGGNPDMLVSQLAKKHQDDEQFVTDLRAKCASEHDEVIGLGGLYILGTERHESRRIDNQLRGRAGRQGDPGKTRFYLSLEDDLMRIFGGEKMQGMLTKLGFEEGEAIEHPWVSKAIENSQKKVEGRNFDVRKQLLEYDDVMNQQRDVIYVQRRELLEAEDVDDVMLDMSHDFVDTLVEGIVPKGTFIENWDLKALEEALLEKFAMQVSIQEWLDNNEVEESADLQTAIHLRLNAMLDAKAEMVGAEELRNFKKFLVLQVLDHLWKDHLLAMDHLRQSVGLRGIAQKQPLQEYKRESFELFSKMLDKIRENTISTLHKVQVNIEEPKENEPVILSHHDLEDAPEAKKVPQMETVKRDQPKVGRNDPCPCNSGKKYKQCHGKKRK
ncbi:MAG: preprotein translocase subunit SecA [Mariprofundaceae bacterium]|nr:preprotein translocase subunit SecA [Mariprofundaceae bacterium]